LGLWNPIGDRTFATQPFLESAKPLNKERPIGRSSDGDRRRHTQKMQRRLHATIDHLREVIDKVDDRQLKAMFRGTRRVEEGLWRLRTEERKPVARVLLGFLITLIASSKKPGRGAKQLICSAAIAS
jgi:hypothetical protein